MNDSRATEASLFLQLEPICDDFEASWQPATQPRIEDYLEQVGPGLQEQLLLELCSIEIEQRLRANQKPTTSEYVKRFPDYESSLKTLSQQHPEWKLEATNDTGEETVNTVAPQEETNTAVRLESTKTAATVVKSAKAPSPSHDFGDYELLEEIGQGGMGVIYKARQRKLNRIVAIKMIRAGQLASQSDIQRFHTEAEAIGQLEHPQIVPIYEVDEENGVHFFSMAFIDGEDLSKKLQDGPLPPRQAAQLVHEIAMAIDYAHQQGIIHRDLKPANILLTRDGQIRVTDFGLAKQQNADQGPTVTGDIVGTPGYMAPEQAAGDRTAVGITSDVYSLGAILYSLLTGRPPFQAATMVDTLIQVINDPPVSPRQLNPAVDRDLETICLKCLEKTNARRYETAQELSQELKRFLDGHPIQARPVAALPRLWRWCCRHPKLATAWATVAALLLVLGIAGPLVAVRESRLKTVASRAARDSRRSANKYRQEQERADKAAKMAILQRKRANQQAEVANQQKLLATQQAVAANRALYDTRMTLAQAAWKNANATSVQRLLDFYKEPLFENDYRGFEWHYLSEQLSQDVFTIDANPGFSILDIAIHPNSKQIASIGGDGFLRIWNANNGKKIHEVSLNANRGDCMDYSPDGALLAIGTRSGKIHFLDSTTLQQKRQLNVGTVGLSNIDLLPGNLCIARNEHGAILSVRLDTNEVKIIQKAIVTGEYLNKPVYQQRRFACSDDGKHLAFNGSNWNVICWDLEQNKQKSLLKGPRVSTSSKVAPALDLSTDGQSIAHGDRRGEISVWQPSNGISLHRNHDHLAEIEQVVFTPDNQVIVSAGKDRTIRITHLGLNRSNRHRLPRVLHGHEADIRSLAVASNNKFIASADRKGILKVFSIAGVSNPRYHRVQDNARGLAFHPKAKTYALAQSKKTVGIWGIRNQQLEPLQTLTGHQEKPTFLTFHPHGVQLSAGLYDGTIYIWNPATGKYLRQFKGHKKPVATMAYSPDGTRLASISADNQLKLWDPDTGQLIRSIPLTYHSGDLSWNQEGTRVVIGKSGSQSVVVDIVSGKPVFTLPGPSGFYTPDGQHLIHLANKTIVVCNASTGKETKRLSGPANRILDAIVSKDSQRLIALDERRNITLWNLKTGLQVLDLKLADSHVGGRLFIGPQGRTLAHLGSNATVWSTNNAKKP